jgi:hypothetical protein
MRADGGHDRVGDVRVVISAPSDTSLRGRGASTRSGNAAAKATAVQLPGRTAHERHALEFQLVEERA